MGHTLATSIAPLFLRALLGIVFVWAGLTKFVADFPVSPDNAPRLAEWGVIAGASQPTPAPAARPDPAPSPSATPPTTQTPPPLAAMPGAPPADARTVRRLYAIALLVHSAANPTPRDDGSIPMRLMPAELGKGSWPVRLAWAATITELAGGGLVLLGLLTRLSALSLAVVMLNAMWLTQLGPAVQSGNTVAFILPAHDAFDGHAWQDLIFQFSLFCSAMALACTGSGILAFDRALFRPAPPPRKPPAETPAQRPL